MPFFFDDRGALELLGLGLGIALGPDGVVRRSSQPCNENASDYSAGRAVARTTPFNPEQTHEIEATISVLAWVGGAWSTFVRVDESVL